jgi:hypothetical protein
MTQLHPHGVKDAWKAYHILTTRNDRGSPDCDYLPHLRSTFGWHRGSNHRYVTGRLCQSVVEDCALTKAPGKVNNS